MEDTIISTFNMAQLYATNILSCAHARQKNWTEGEQLSMK